MKLNHLDLQVVDVQRTVALFEGLFAFRMESNRQSPAIAILSDGAGFQLVLQRKKDPAAAYPDGFHIGFLVESVDTVHAVHARAVGFPGLASVSDVQTNNRGTMLYLRTDDGVLIEVSCRTPSVAPRSGT